MGLESSPAGWYRSSFAENFESLFWEEGGEAQVGLALRMLQPEGGERVLDLSCGTGRRALELCRRGYDVVGIDIRACLLELGGVQARDEGLWPYFAEEDPRYLDFEAEFDLLLSLGGGAFGHFGDDAEDMRALECSARALRPAGRLLMQTPNLDYIEERLPERTWVTGSRAIDLIEQDWDPVLRRFGGERELLLAEEDLKYPESAPFQRRVYSVEELAEAFEHVGLGLSNVFDESGQPCAPDQTQRELFVEAQKSC